jgi:arabinogalactan oligomer/maltooligosaccharide transport system substrate-binding protein
MRRLITRFALTLSFAALSLPFAFQAPAQAKELVVWHAYRAEEKAAMEKVAALYNEANKAKGVKVTTLAVPWDAFADKISAAVPRGKGPDLFIYPQDRLGGWIEAGNTVEPLDFFLEKNITDRFIPSTLEAMKYRGTTYGLPLDFKVLIMIYNKKLVTTPPKTSGELVALAKKLTNKKTGHFGLAYSYSDFYYHAALMNGFGGRVFDPGPKAVMNAPENVKSGGSCAGWRRTVSCRPSPPRRSSRRSSTRARRRWCSADRGSWARSPRAWTTGSRRCPRSTRPGASR